MFQLLYPTITVDTRRDHLVPATHLFRSSYGLPCWGSPYRSVVSLRFDHFPISNTYLDNRFARSAFWAVGNYGKWGAADDTRGISVSEASPSTNWYHCHQSYHWSCAHNHYLGLPSLFLPYEVSGKSVILEVQVVSPPNRRSWFMSDEVLEGTCTWLIIFSPRVFTGLVDGKLLIMTPIDPAFLLIPILRVLSVCDLGCTFVSCH